HLHSRRVRRPPYRICANNARPNNIAIPCHAQALPILLPQAKPRTTGPEGGSHGLTATLFILRHTPLEHNTFGCPAISPNTRAYRLMRPSPRAKLSAIIGINRA